MMLTAILGGLSAIGGMAGPIAEIAGPLSGAMGGMGSMFGGGGGSSPDIAKADIGGTRNYAPVTYNSGSSQTLMYVLAGIAGIYILVSSFGSKKRRRKNG